MTWIYDETTPHSRLMVAYDRYGITVRQWDETDCDYGVPPFFVSERFFTWDTYRTRERCYSRDDGSGRLKIRLVHAAISLMAHWGGSSDSSGYVSSLHEYVNGGPREMC